MSFQAYLDNQAKTGKTSDDLILKEKFSLGQRACDGPRGRARESQNMTGLCADCVYASRIQSMRGSTFFLCERSATDPAFAKYPHLPVMSCPGYLRIEDRRDPRSDDNGGR